MGGRGCSSPSAKENMKRSSLGEENRGSVEAHEGGDSVSFEQRSTGVAFRGGTKNDAETFRSEVVPAVGSKGSAHATVTQSASDELTSGVRTGRRGSVVDHVAEVQ